MKKKVAIAAVALVMIVISLAAYRLKTGRDSTGLALSGTVEVTEVSVGFKVPGRVRALFSDEGRVVRAGDKLAELENAELETLVNQVLAAVRNAEARRGKARSDFDRFTRLYKDEVVSPQQMDAAKAALEEAEAQLQLQQAALRTAKVRLGDAVIFSPLDGVVLRKNTDQGETVSAGTPVYTIGDLAHPWIKVYVKEDKLGLVKLGQRAEITVDTFPGAKYEGTVTSISSDAEFTPKNVQTREERVKLVFGVKVSVVNRNDELKPGMPADVRIIVAGSESGVRSSGSK